MAESIRMLLNEYKTKNKETEGKFSENKPHIGTCCVCHNIPSHSRTYYGQFFCINCFHKYIWTPTQSGQMNSGDLKNDNVEIESESK